MNKIIYLDAAATGLKPDVVLAAERNFLENDYANSGRGVCARAMATDEMVYNARVRIARFINAAPSQIVFTSGATDGLNRVVNLAAQVVKSAVPVVAVSDLDHHSARLPWVNMENRGKCKTVVMPLDASMDIDVARVPVADVIIISAMSNVFGVAQDVAGIVRAARVKNPNVIVIVDAAQFVIHEQIDAKKWDADFIVFSGHKIGANTGVGVMYMKKPECFAPDKFGGGMVQTVDGGTMQYNDAPDRFEAGTLPLAQIAGFVPAIEYLEQNRPDLNLIKYMYDELSKIPRIKIFTSRDATLLTFVVRDMHPLDFGTMMGAHGVCLRVGNMCASWAHRKIGVDGTIRISVGPWNTMADAQQTIDIIKDVLR